MAASEKRVQNYLTMEQFRAMDESDEWLYELDDGILVREPRPARPHGTAVMLLGRHLVDYALGRGGIVVTETGVVLAEDPPRVYGPDLAYYREDPAAYGHPSGWIAKAPDLAVEVISPSNGAAAMRRKIGKYFESGTGEVWVVFPSTRSMELHSLEGAIRVLGADEVLESPALPGFQLQISEIFRF